MIQDGRFNTRFNILEEIDLVRALPQITPRFSSVFELPYCTIERRGGSEVDQSIFASWARQQHLSFLITKNRQSRNSCLNVVGCVRIWIYY